MQTVQTRYECTVDVPPEREERERELDQRRRDHGQPIPRLVAAAAAVETRLAVFTNRWRVCRGSSALDWRITSTRMDLRTPWRRCVEIS